MKDKWWNRPTWWKRFTEPFRHPEAVGDAFIVALVLLDLGILALCIYAL